MLIDTTQIEPSALNRFDRWGFDCPIAEDPETGAQLRAGHGRRKAGRPRRYYIYVPAVLLPAGLFDQKMVGTVTAHYDNDATEKANKRLAREARRIAPATTGEGE